MLELHTLAEPLFDQDFPDMQLKRAPGASLAALQHGLSAGNEVLQRAETGSDRGELRRLLHAAKYLELAIAPTKEPPVWRCSVFGAKLHRLAHDFSAGRKARDPCRRNTLRVQPAPGGPGRMGREQAGLIGEPHDEAPGFNRPEPLLGNVFLGLVAAHPHMATDRRAVLVQRKCEDRQGSCAFRVEESGCAAAKRRYSGLHSPERFLLVKSSKIQIFDHVDAVNQGPEETD